jgi:hypothetical protein
MECLTLEMVDLIVTGVFNTIALVGILLISGYAIKKLMA